MGPDKQLHSLASVQKMGVSSRKSPWFLAFWGCAAIKESLGQLANEHRNERSR